MKAKVGMAWYRREQWQRLIAASADNDDLEETYDEWEQAAEKQLGELRQRGESVRKVEVDVDALLKWCEANKVALNGSARARFVAEQMRAGDA